MPCLHNRDAGNTVLLFAGGGSSRKKADRACRLQIFVDPVLLQNDGVDRADIYTVPIFGISVGIVDFEVPSVGKHPAVKVQRDGFAVPPDGIPQHIVVPRIADAGAAVQHDNVLPRPIDKVEILGLRRRRTDGKNGKHEEQNCQPAKTALLDKIHYLFFRHDSFRPFLSISIAVGRCPTAHG